ncbi:MAG: glucose-1-phosphate adenylyltransferase subunit GlgD [Eubacteriales bacterium]|nr:glucose-1-phosphate adenylyltransferase subunit GlgD [Eubacteriales bacterium]MDD4389300.1 glucose-1-phosphate adenylyltransferase subunit GlgD [Eubacteriales bacterium]
MRNVLGINFSYSDDVNLRELTRIRTLASLPLGGKYRIIDFVLSSFVNAGIYDVSVITKNNYHSLVDHVGAGKDWDMTRKRGGLRILSPMSNVEFNPLSKSIYKGSLDALYCHMSSIRRSMAEYVIMMGSSTVCCGIDYNELLKNHINTNADITAVYRTTGPGEETIPYNASIFSMGDENRINSVTFNKDEIKPQEANWSTDIYVIKKSLLESLVADCISAGKYSWHADILHRLVGQLNIRGYEYKGVLFDISTVSGYMKANMDFLNEDVQNGVFSRPIYTKVKNSVPSLYAPGCSVKNSLLADNCVIEGSVENSIISRGVKIGRGSIVKNSIVMQNTEIMQNVTLEHIILDKDVIVRDGRHIAGHETYPVVVEKKTIV